MKAIDLAGFEGKFRENIDPWDYTNSGFEHFKRTVLLRACGHGKRGRALELGCAIGETTRYLAPLCLRLVALDGSLTALAEARRGAPQAREARAREDRIARGGVEEVIFPEQF